MTQAQGWRVDVISLRWDARLIYPWQWQEIQMLPQSRGLASAL